MEENTAKKMVVELIGGVGTGKSRVLDILKEDYQAVVIQADEVAKHLEEKGQAGLIKLTEAFGTGILDSEGNLDRTAFAEKVFQDPEALEQVNVIIHPLVWNWIYKKVREIQRGLVIVETAVPDKNPGDIYDEVWYLYTLRETRIRRLMENRGYSREKCLQMMANQLSEEEYRSLSDRELDNNGSPEDMRSQLKSVLGQRFTKG